MNFRSPQALVRVDVSHSTQETLIQQQSLDSRAACPCLFHKFREANLQRVGAEREQFFRQRARRKISKPPESSCIGIAQFTIVVEQEASVGMFFARLSRWIRRDLSGHSEVDEKRGRRSVAICRGRRNAVDRRKTQKHELAITLDGFDSPAGELLLERGRIIDEIRLAKPHRQNPPAHNRAPQTSRYCLDFRKFGHEGIANKITHPPATMQATEANPKRSAIGR